MHTILINTQGLTINNDQTYWQGLLTSAGITGCTLSGIGASNFDITLYCDRALTTQECSDLKAVVYAELVTISSS